MKRIYALAKMYINVLEEANLTFEDSEELMTVLTEQLRQALREKDMVEFFSADIYELQYHVASRIGGE